MTDTAAIEETMATTWAGYTAAWADHDIERIMSMHAESTAFQLHNGGPRAVGHAAVRQAFEAVFETFPDLRFQEVRTVVTGELVAYEYLATATPAGASTPVTLEVVDVLEFRAGLVTRKDTYLDSAALVAHLTGVDSPLVSVPS